MPASAVVCTTHHQGQYPITKDWSASQYHHIVRNWHNYRVTEGLCPECPDKAKLKECLNVSMQKAS